ncbi:MAG: hypothetical protein JW881_16525 [Spirochaetales bacterium]|nr:hypothetical protein [Spirochaetales bacterium]
MKEKKNNEDIRLDLGFSLLWPKGRKVSTTPLRKETVEDLDIPALIRFFTETGKSRDSLESMYTVVCNDEETLNYRLDILEDLLRSPDLAGCWEEILPDIRSLTYFTLHFGAREITPFQEVVWRLRELEFYSRCVRRLGKAFGEALIRSRGLTLFSALIGQIEEDPVFVRLLSVLPELLATINNLGSITIGVNLNAGLIPCGVTLLSINKDLYTDKTLYRRIFGAGGTQGIAPLHTAPEGTTDPLLDPVIKDVAKIMEEAAAPLARSLKKFISINSRLLVRLHDEFIFFLGAVKGIKKLERYGLPMVRPRVLKKEARSLHYEGLYNINLAIQKSDDSEQSGAIEGIVPNDFEMNETGRIVILTGPNRGGKTTFTQAVGLSQVLMQAGLYVPAQRAEISITDQLLTHFPVKESLSRGTGRFGEEARRLHTIFDTATRFSLILLNESLSSTNAGESIYLAQDIMRVFRMLGTRVIFTTHFHQLAAMTDDINADTDGESALISLVAGVYESDPEPSKGGGEEPGIRPTFKILPGQPKGRSYAIELAARFGITKNQLVDVLKKRGAV